MMQFFWSFSDRVRRWGVRNKPASFTLTYVNVQMHIEGKWALWECASQRRLTWRETGHVYSSMLSAHLPNCNGIWIYVVSAQVQQYRVGHLQQIAADLGRLFDVGQTLFSTSPPEGAKDWPNKPVAWDHGVSEWASERASEWMSWTSKQRRYRTANAVNSAW